MAGILLCSSAVGVCDSQAYKKFDVTWECICPSMKLREMLLSLQIGFNHVNAAVICAILESISGFEPLSDTTDVLITATLFLFGCSQYLLNKLQKVQNNAARLVLRVS